MVPLSPDRGKFVKISRVPISISKLVDSRALMPVNLLLGLELFKSSLQRPQLRTGVVVRSIFSDLIDTGPQFLGFFGEEANINISPTRNGLREVLKLGRKRIPRIIRSPKMIDGIAVAIFEKPLMIEGEIFSTGEPRVSGWSICVDNDRSVVRPIVIQIGNVVVGKHIHSL